MSFNAINPSAIQLKGEYQNKLSWLYDSPLIEEWIKIQQQFEKLPDLEQFSIELYPESNLEQLGVKIDSELKEKEDEVRPIVLSYRPALEETFKIDITSRIREFVIWAYMNTDIEDLRYKLPDDVLDDLIRFAKENQDAYNKKVEIARSDGAVAEESQLVTASKPTNGVKVSHKELALRYYYLHESDCIPRFDAIPGVIKKTAFAIAEKHGLAGNKFYQTYLSILIPKKRATLANKKSIQNILPYLEEYPKAYGLAVDDINRI